MQRPYLMPKPLLYLLLLQLLLSGCSKPKTIAQTETSTERSTTFPNKTDKRIHLFVYTSIEDYTNSTNPLITTDIEPGSNYKLLMNDMRTYYVDWYADEYAYTNWSGVFFQKTFSLSHIILPDKTPDTFAMTKSSELYRNARLFALNGNQPQTVWRAASAFKPVPGNKVSIWNDLSADDKARSFILKKDMTASYITTVNGNSITSANGKIVMNYSNDNVVLIRFNFLNLIDPNTVVPYITDGSSIEHLPLGMNRSKDTMNVSIHDTIWYFFKQ